MHERIAGTVHPKFAPLREAFAALEETSAGFAVQLDGETVVDLWTSGKWVQKSIVNVFSVTKPLAALCVLRLVDRGDIDLDADVDDYWPEYAANGKESTTVRQILANQAGLVAFSAPHETTLLYDWDGCVRRIAAEALAWPPGKRHGEAALLYGYLAGEIVRRVDGRGLSRFFQDEIAQPLGLDIHFGLSDEHLARAVDVEDPGGRWKSDLLGSAPDLRRRALGNPPGLLDPGTLNSREWRKAEILGVNGHSGAVALAKLYGVLANARSSEQVISSALFDEMVRVHAEGEDAVFGMPVSYGLGMRLDGGPFRSAEFGYGGIGGSVAFGNRARNMSFAFVTGTLRGPERAMAFEKVLVELI